MICVGIDWAGAHQNLCVEDGEGHVLPKGRVPDGVEGVGRIHEILAALASEPAEVAIGIELLDSADGPAPVAIPAGQKGEGGETRESPPATRPVPPPSDHPPRKRARGPDVTASSARVSARGRLVRRRTHLPGSARLPD